MESQENVWKIKMWAALEGPHFRHIVSGVKNAQCADDTVIISHFNKKSIVFEKSLARLCGADSFFINGARVQSPFANKKAPRLRCFFIGGDGEI